MYDNVDGNVEEEDEKDDNGDVAEDEVEIDDVEDDEVKEEEDDVENDDVEGEKDDDVEEEGRSQDREPHFVRACTVEMHLDISHGPLCAEISR